MKGKDVTVQVLAASATASAPPPSVTMTVYLLLDWLEIAIRHEHAAKLARQRGDGGAERQEAMIAVSASAHAVDGLAHELEQRLDDEELEMIAKPERRADRAGRAGQVNAVLMLAVGVDGEKWRDGLIALIKTLRDTAVHPKAAATAPAPHPDPSKDERVAVESVLYSVEGATRSVDLTCEITRHVVAAASPAAKSVAGEIAPRVDQLLAERKRLDEASGTTPHRLPVL